MHALEILVAENILSVDSTLMKSFKAGVTNGIEMAI